MYQCIIYATCFTEKTLENMNKALAQTVLDKSVIAQQNQLTFKRFCCDLGLG